MKLAEWLGSKKTKDAILLSFILIVADLLKVSPEVMYTIGAVFGVKIGGQAHVDAKLAANKKE